MFLIGLTGGIGTGKTTISNYLRKCDITVLDSDLIARKVVKPGTSCWHKIVQEFGQEAIEQETGEINRAYLAEIIFNDPQKRLTLNRITHKEIQKKIILKIIWNFFLFRPYVVLDVPLFFEVKSYQKFCSYTIVVRSTREQQFQRLKERNNYNEDEASRRIDAQMPIDEKCRLADFVIDNTGSREASIEQINHIFRGLSFPVSFWIFRLALIGFYISISFIVPWIFFRR